MPGPPRYGHEADLFSAFMVKDCRDELWAALAILVPSDHEAWTIKPTAIPGDPGEQLQFRLLGFILVAQRFFPLTPPSTWRFYFPFLDFIVHSVRLTPGVAG